MRTGAWLALAGAALALAGCHQAANRPDPVGRFQIVPTQPVRDEADADGNALAGAWLLDTKEGSVSFCTYQASRVSCVAAD